MTCIHNNFDEDQSWGGCIHCSEEEKHRAYYERNHPPVYYDPPEPEFIPNQFHYHVKIKKNSIVVNPKLKIETSSSPPEDCNWEV